MIRPPPVLEMQNVNRTFRSARGEAHVLRGVDLRIEPGDFAAITGPSGSGKTTFLNLATLLDRPDTGRVLLDGVDVSALAETELSRLRREHVGMVFQAFHLLPYRSALANVLFRFRYLQAPPREAKEQARAALRQVDLEARADQPARLLSGGEMQRVAIARAIAQRPRLLAADEPTGNLDAASARAVMRTFHELNRQGITIILVTHNEQLLPFCSRHFACRDGVLEEV